MRQVRDLGAKLEFCRAGLSEADKMDSVILTAEIERIYVLWGLLEIDGLTIDGERATPGTFSSRGPEHLFNEVLLAVQSQCNLTEKERKN
jgi:hypothetical protein